MFGLTTNDVRSLAYQLAVRNGLPNSFNKKKEKAGKDWLQSFMKRNPELTLRQPEATSAARAMSFNPVNVNKFFDLYESIMDKFHFPPHRIFNCDETGVTTVQGKPSKVLAKTGRRQVGGLVSAERGQLVTVELCMNVTGTFIPPLFIFPRVRMKMELMNGAPPGSIYACHKSGWMQLTIFVDWFKHFIQATGASKENPVLLILDGHATHTMNLEVIDLARDKGVVILCLPPHCSHRMQPLDVSFMKPLMTYYDQELEKWLRNHPGRVVTTFQTAELFGNAYTRAATAQTAMNGFRKTGIYPSNRDIFEPHEFAACEPTNTAQPPAQPEVPGQADTQPDVPGQADTQPEVPAQADTQPEVPAQADTQPEVPAQADTQPEVPAQADTQPEVSAQPDTQPEISAQPVSQPEVPAQPVTQPDVPPAKLAQPEVLAQPVTQPEVRAQAAIQPDAAPQPSTSRQYISPYTISPIPKVSARSNRRPNARRGKTVILTSSPYKASLAEAKRFKAEKEKAAQDRKAKREAARQAKGKKGEKRIGTQSRNQPKPKHPRNQAPPNQDDNPPKNADQLGDDEDDAQCIYCAEMWSDTKQDAMIRCTGCLQWAHTKCAGVDENDEEFVCDFCA